ncbi:MAG: phospholipase D-like domain-containing protein [Bacteroidota bacterium]
MLFKSHVYKPAHSISLLRSGSDYFNRIEHLIDNARFSIHIQVYIFDLDQTGNIILEKLRAAVRRGVNVYLVVDGYASPHITASVIQSLKAEGIFAKRFAPFHIKSLKIGRRLHHKIVLVDDDIAIIGGINIANKYSGYDKHAPWLDVAIEIQGKICADVKIICYTLWPKRIRKKWKKNFMPANSEGDYSQVCISQNDWWRRKIEISKTYRDMIRESKKEFILMASYFLPGFRKRLFLKKAAERGVKITVILGGLSDIPLLKPAMHYLYSVLCKHDITIYEWAPSVLHGKMAIADGHLTTVGSYNLNALSDYGSLELNVNVESTTFAQSSTAFIENIIAEGCVLIQPTQYRYKAYSLLHAYRFICFQLLRLLLFVLFVLMRRDRMKNKHF